MNNRIRQKRKKEEETEITSVIDLLFFLNSTSGGQSKRIMKWNYGLGGILINASNAFWHWRVICRWNDKSIVPIISLYYR